MKFHACIINSTILIRVQITAALFIAYKSIISIGNLAPVGPFSPAMLHMFTRVYLCLPCSLFHVYLPYLLVFTYVYSCLPMYATVYSCLPIFTTVYTCLFACVYSCLLVFTYVYTCLPMFTPFYQYLPCLHVFTYIYPC